MIFEGRYVFIQYGGENEIAVDEEQAPEGHTHKHADGKGHCGKEVIAQPLKPPGLLPANGLGASQAVKKAHHEVEQLYPQVNEGEVLPGPAPQIASLGDT